MCQPGTPAHHRLQRVQSHVVRVVGVHVDLLYDHLFFSLHLLRIEGRVLDHISEHVGDLTEVAVEGFYVKAGVFLSRKGVHLSAYAVDLVRDLECRPCLRALEKHVLYVVGHAEFLRLFVDRTSIAPDADGHRSHTFHFLCYQSYSRIEYRDLCHLSPFCLPSIFLLSGPASLLSHPLRGRSTGCQGHIPYLYPLRHPMRAPPAPDPVPGLRSCRRCNQEQS